MQKFYWKGEQLSGASAGSGIAMQDLIGTSITEQRKCNWNRPQNWFVKVAGPSAGNSSGTFGTGGFLGNDDFHFVAATQAPGGDDRVIFEKFTYNSQDYPVSPCLYGGYWSTGWVNAANTGGQCSVIIEESYGDAGNVLNTCEGPAAGQIGIGVNDRSVLGAISSTLAQQYAYGAGVSMTGLRLNSTRVLNKAESDLELYLADSECTNYTSYASRCNSRFDGGTYAQIDINSQSDTTPGSGYQTDRTVFEMADDYWTGNTANITQFAIVQNVASHPIGASRSKVSFRSTTSIPSLVVVPLLRPASFSVDANVTDATVYPELRKSRQELADGRGYNTIVFGNLKSGLTVQNLKLRDEAPGLSGADILTEYDAAYQGATRGQDVVGANNLVGFNAAITVNNLEIGAGRVVLGRRDRYLSLAGGSGGEVALCDLEENDQVLIEGGLISGNGMLDLTNPVDQTYKGAKVGPGVSHPSEGEGMQIIGDEANIRYPRDMFFVADYRVGLTGASFDVFELYPVIGFAKNR